ncbi:ER membrane protein complex subunit 1 [Tribolium madens]|uniref:ER membrane protein complex subunit 1 n=1 Tax=Tribolium madens TaxID=41895 RepID=UPI001CF75031|nr:ER membrane protein complex subunit 1 [Tribolium madens]
MANFGQIITICVTIFSVNAIYEDQVGKFDWKRSFIGKVKHAQFDNNRLIVTTHENIVASLSPKTGEILWRQLMEHPQEHQPQFLHVDRDVVTVSGAKTRFYVRGWDAPSGSLLWEWPLVLDRSGDSFWMLKGDVLVHIAPVPGSHMEITHFSLKTGEIRKKTRKIPETWVSEKCTTANPYFVCLSNGQLFWFDVVNEDSKSNSHSIQSLSDCNLLEFDSPKPSVLLVRHNKAKIVEIGGSVLPHDLSPNAVSIGNSVFQLEANLDNMEKLIRVKSFNLLTGQSEISVDIDYPLGLGGPYIVSGQCRGPSCELLLSSTDHALTLVRLPEGKVSWTREEALSNIVSVEFFELPVSDLEVSIENEFTESSNDIMTMFTRRISTQTKQFYNLVSGQFGSIRDDFGLHRIIVVATSVGKLFGIDTLHNGSIVWTYRLPNVKAFNDVTMMLLVQRTARHAPLPAQCVLLAEDATTGGGILFAFDPISGASRGLQRLGYRVKQAFLLPNEDENHLKPVVVIGADDSVHVYPESDRKIVRRNSYVYTIGKSLVQGYRLDPDFGLKPVWNLNLGLSELVGVSTRPMAERVHSQGRVLHDRSVHYKYVNPNLIALATLSDDPVHKSVLSVFLVDGVTGFVVYSTSHKKAKGPVHLVHSENWLVYTFFNERFRRTEIVSAEMYEGSSQSNSTVFSSFGISQLPQVKTESYILPANPVSMSVTLTERGITNKFLLVGMSSGSVVEIPWMLLQPRFADMPCGPEESCFPYLPEISLPPEATINYNQTLARIRKIEVAPAKLESTSHVLVHGLDMFYTRVAPSKTFDLLKEDFDHRLIVLVLAGLVIASYVTKYLAAKKALRQAWK